MFPAARKTDPITHDLLAPSGIIGPPISGPCPMGPVLIEALPGAHVLCTVACTGVITAGIAHPPPPGPPPPIVLGAATVHIHGQFASRWAPSGDAGGCGVFLGNPLLTATRKTLIGGPPGSVTPGAGGNITATIGGMVVNGSPQDVATWMSMMAREMRNSNNFRNATMAMINDTAHPVTFNVGHNNAFFVDSFANNNVDLDDLGWFPVNPDPNYPWVQTQGEAMTHIIAERRDAAVNGSAFGPAHGAALAPGGPQHQYRQDRGQPGNVVSQTMGPNAANPSNTDLVSTDNAGNQTIWTLDSSNQPIQRQWIPAAPTPAAPGVTSSTPPP